MHPSKTLSPSDDRDDGSVIDSRDEHPEKTALPSNVKDGGSVIDWKDVHR